VALRLDVREAGFAASFARLVADRASAAPDVERAVAQILAAVRARGDEAVRDYVERFDGVSLEPAAFRIRAAEIAAAVERVPAAARAALDLAAERITAHHQRQLPTDDRYTDALGVELGSRWTPLAAVGLYVPGGTAAYPSSVLMNALPARVAGVGRIAMVVPCGTGGPNPLVLAAAARAGITEIYRIGGAQAVAALAYGTATIAPVDKIVGPGNAYVAAAKRLVFGVVGIDLIAGPSEIVVVADGRNDPEWIAADLLSQAEHDEAAQAILLTDDDGFADRVEAAVARRLATLARSAIATASWRDHGAVVVVAALADAPELIDRLAPEHLELALDDAAADALAEQVHHAGAIFLGRHTPEAIGDYVAGTNHVLPTARGARFSSGLSVQEFVKRTSLVRCDARSLRRIGPAAITLAEAEGLTGHAESVRVRLRAATT